MMDKDALDGLISLLDNWSAFFTLLVVIGVGGELVTHVMQSRANKNLIALQRTESLAQEAEIARIKKDSASFELDIANAKRGAADALERAAKAEENLGNAKKDAALALQHAADANRIAEEERLKRVQIEERMKPRSLKLGPLAMSTLRAYKGTEYTFSSVFADEESITLLKQLDSILHSAGWTRVKPPHAYPAINVYGQEQDFAVASSLSSSIKVSVDSELSLATLQATPVGQLPAPAGAAVVLAVELTASLAPPQDDGVKANVQPGKSTTVRIEIGRKP
jgi:hypothetical protein